MAFLRRAACAALTVALAACDPTPGPTELNLAGGEVAIHAILVAGADTAAVVITQMNSVTLARHMNEAVGLPLHGAVVDLIGGADTVRLAPRSGCRVTSFNAALDSLHSAGGCYAAAVEGRIVPGRTYRLHALLPSGVIVRGSATVPNAPVISAPETGATLHVHAAAAPPAHLESMHVRWSQAGRGRTELRIVPAAECMLTLLDATTGVVGVHEIMAGTTELQLQGRMLYCNLSEPVERMPARLVISSYDDNYSRYAARSLGATRLPAGDAAAGITGAYGVFGAVASAERVIEVVVRK